MKKVIAGLTVLLMVSPLSAQQKACDELKSEIQAKLEAKGVKDFQLDIVKSEDVKDQKVVGSCEAGTKKITYTRGAAAEPKMAAAAPAKDSAAKPKPQPKP